MIGARAAILSGIKDISISIKKKLVAAGCRRCARQSLAGPAIILVSVGLRLSFSAKAAASNLQWRHVICYYEQSEKGSCGLES